jgi:hypothetical protein
LVTSADALSARVVDRKVIPMRHCPVLAIPAAASAAELKDEVAQIVSREMGPTVPADGATGVAMAVRINSPKPCS